MPSLRHIVRRICPSFILPSSSSSSSSSPASVCLSTEMSGEREGEEKKRKDGYEDEDTPTVEEEEEEHDNDNDDDGPTMFDGPRPLFAHTRHLMLSSRSSFLDLPSRLPMKENKSKKKKKLSFSPSLYGSRPQTAPSTPTSSSYSSSSSSSSPRLLKSLSRFGPSSSPSLPLPRLSFSATSPHPVGNRKQSGQLGARNDDREREMMMTPPLSFCSKEVAEDPFARVCPSPEFSRPSSIKPSIYATSSRNGSPTVSRPPSSSRRHPSSKSSSGHLGKASMRPSTAPALSFSRTTSSSGGTPEHGISTPTQRLPEISDPFLDINVGLAEKSRTNVKPILPPIATSMTSPSTAPTSFNELSRSISSTSHTSSSSNSFPSSPTSPAELVSTFSSSYSSIRSGFSAATFTTLDTVVTGSNVSNEGGNHNNNNMNAGTLGSLPSKNRGGDGFGGRMRSNAITFERTEGENNAPLVWSSCSRSIMQHGFFEEQTSKDLPSSTTVIVTSPSSKKKKKDGKAKMLLGMPLESAMNPELPRVKEHHHINDNADGKRCVANEDEDDSIPDEVVLRGIEAQDERLKSKTSLRCNDRPAHVHSRFIEDLLHEDSLLASSSSSNVADDGNFSSAILHRSAFTKDQLSELGSKMKDTPFHACIRSFTAPAAILRESQGSPIQDPFSSDFIITDPIQVNNQESESTNTIGQETTTDSPTLITDYANRHISFTQSTYDLVLSYGGEERTAIPLPQMSWFPEPPPFAPCTLLTSTSSSSSPSSSSGTPLFSARRKRSSVDPPTSATSTVEAPHANVSLWNGMFKGRTGGIEKVSIGYPLPMVKAGDSSGAVLGKKA